MRFITPLLNYAYMMKYDHLQIEPTTRCNLSCKTCPHKDGVPIIDMSPLFLNELLDKHHSRNHIHFINLQGLGEPFMHPEFIDMCLIAENYTDILKTFTNGTIFNAKATEFLDEITVSLDTMDAKIAKEIKGHGYDLHAVLNNIIKYNQVIQTNVNFTQSIYNYTEKDAVREWCNQNKVTFNVTRVQNWNSPDEILWKSNHDDIIKERLMFGAIRPEKSTCQWRKLKWYYYRADGVRNPCCRRLGYRTYGEECCETCPD